MTDLSHAEWDAWRGDPLTKRCIRFLGEKMENKHGAAATREIEENYGAIFADSARQAQYSRLRGMVDGVKDLAEVLKLDLNDLNEPSELNEEDQSKNL